MLTAAFVIEPIVHIGDKIGRWKLMIYFINGKCPKILNTLFHIFLAQILFFMQLFLNPCPAEPRYTLPL